MFMFCGLHEQVVRCVAVHIARGWCEVLGVFREGDGCVRGDRLVAGWRLAPTSLVLLGVLHVVWVLHL